jgi:hypothetical protein
VNSKSMRPLLALVLAATTVGLTCPLSFAEGLDLSNATRNVTVDSSHITGPTAIRVGGTVRMINPGDSLTHAEFVALTQVVNAGTQQLNIDSAGRAASGSFVLNNLPANMLSGLTLPAGVTAVNNFAANPNLNFANSLVNSGALFAVSTNVASTIANISAANIVNNHNALLTTVLPANGLPGFSDAIGSLNLSLTAAGDIINHGTISSAGSLTVTAGGGIYNASATSVLSAAQDVNFKTDTIHNSGTVQASGNINLVPLGTDLNVRGGDWVSHQLNIDNKDGEVNFYVGEISGLVNLQAKDAHFIADSSVLRLGAICLTGDPLIANSGTIHLSNGAGITTNGAPLGVIAGEDILAFDDGSGALVINTGTTTHGGNVVMSAGTNFQVQGDLSLLINGTTARGGQIDLSAGPGIAQFTTSPTGSNGNGGNVTLVAHGGNGTDSDIFAGKVTLPLLSVVTTGGTGSGNNGNFTVIAGELSAESASIVLGGVDTSGGSGTGGAIQLYTATVSSFANGNGGVPITMQSNGELAPGHQFVPDVQSAQLGGIELQDNDIVALSLTGTGRLGVQVRAGNSMSIGAVTYVPNGHLGDEAGALAEFLLTEDPDPVSIYAGNSIALGNLVAPEIGSGSSIQKAEVKANGGSLLVANVTGVEVSLSGSTSLTVDNVTAEVVQLSTFGLIDVNGVLDADSISLSGAQIGTQAEPIVVAADNRVSYHGTNIWIVSQGNITLGGGGVSGTANISTQNNGDIIIAGLDPGGYFANILGPIAHYFNGSNPGVGITKLTAHGSGDIRQDGIVAMYGAQLIMESGTGDIGAGNLWSLPAIGIPTQDLYMWVATPIVEARTAGSVALIQRPFGESAILPDYVPTPLIEVKNSSIGNGSYFYFESQPDTADVKITNLTAGNNTSIVVASRSTSVVSGNITPKNGTIILNGITAGDFSGVFARTNETVDVTAPISTGFDSEILLQGNKDILLGGQISTGQSSSVTLDSGTDILVAAKTVTGSNSSITAIAGRDIYSIVGGTHFETPILSFDVADDIGSLATRLQVKTAALNISGADTAFLKSEIGEGLTLGTINAGEVDIVADQGMTTGAIISADKLTLTATNGDLNFNHTTTGDSGVTLTAVNGSVNNAPGNYIQTIGAPLSVLTPELNNGGVLFAGSGNVSVSSPFGEDLTVTGGAYQAANTTFAAPGALHDTNTVFFGSGANVQFQGNATIVANGDDQPSIQIGDNTAVSGTNSVTIFGRGYDLGLGSSLSGHPIRIISPRGEGVIAARHGDLVLNSNIVNDGHHLALLAKGNIIAGPAFSSINLSSKTSYGGQVSLIAGHDISANPTGPSVHDRIFGTVYTVVGPSQMGGSVLMPKVAINTSTTTTNFEKSQAGDVVAVGTAGHTNPGVVMLKSVTATANSLNGSGGRVTLIGEGGVSVGDINTSAANGGAITVMGAEPKIVGGPMIYQDGYNRSAASFSFEDPRDGAGASITTGKVNSAGLNGNAGNVKMFADATITVKGIDASSKKVSAAIANGAQVSLFSSEDNILVSGNVNVSGADVASVTSNLNGGHAGSFLARSPSLIQVNGIVDASGGSVAGTGNAGAGGYVTMTSSRSVDVANDTDNYSTAKIYVTKYIDATGGNASSAPGGGAGGAGGHVSLDGATVLITDDAGAPVALSNLHKGASVDTSAGNGAAGSGTSGSINIDTYAVQPLPTNLDLVSSAKTEYVQPGGLFSVLGNGSTSAPLKLTPGQPLLNGVWGVLRNASGGISQGHFDNSNDLEAPVSNITIDVHGDTYAVNREAGPNAFSFSIHNNGVRSKVPAATAVALFQQTHGQTQTIGVKSDGSIATNFNGGTSSFTVDAKDMRSEMNSFQLRSPSSFFLGNEIFGGNVEMNVTGLRPVLDLGAAKSNIAGTLRFVDANATSMIELGSKAFPLYDYGKIATANTGRLILTGSSGSWLNKGTIEVGALGLLPTAGAFTWTNQGFEGVKPAAGATDFRMMVPQDGKLPVMTFVNSIDSPFFTGADNAKLSFENMGLGLGFTNADRALPLSSNTRNVNLTFKYGQVGSPEAVITGLVHGDTVTIKGVVNKTVPGAPTAGLNTSLRFLQADVISDKAMVIDSVASVVAEQSVFEAGGYGTTSKLTATARSHALFDTSYLFAGGGLTVKALESSASFIDGTMIGTNTGLVVVESKGELLLNGGTAFSSGGVKFESKGTPSLSCGQCGVVRSINSNITSGKDVTLRGNGGVEVGGSIQAGMLSPTAPSGLLPADAFISKGKIEIVAGNSTTTSPVSRVTLLAGADFIANGGDVIIKSWTQDVIFNNPTWITANGGNVQVLAKNEIRDTNNQLGTQISTITSRAAGTATSFKGGGVEFVTGATSSTALKTAFAAVATVSPFELGGLGADITINPSGGAILLTRPNLLVSPVDLDKNINDTAAVLNLNGGAIVFTVKNPAPVDSIMFDGIQINVSAYKPIAYTSAAHSTAALLQPDEDATFESRYGQIRAKRGAYVAIEEEHDALRVKTLSGPGHVEITLGGRKFKVAPGEELLVTTSAPSADQLVPPDGIGRRSATTVALAGSGHATISQFSIVSFLQNADYLADVRSGSSPTHKKAREQLLKTAAAIHTLTAGKQGGYTAKPKQARPAKYDRLAQI